LLPKSLVLSAGQVSVLVMVDRTGHVTSAQVEPGKGLTPRSLTLAAERAAQQWVFEPARLDGQPVPSQHSIVFQFGSQ
jgi:TonB family protein